MRLRALESGITSLCHRFGTEPQQHEHQQEGPELNARGL